jgi:hypothetical protein
VTVVAARTDRAWLLPVAVVLALPVVWLNGLAVLVACWPLRRGVPSALWPAAQPATPRPVPA